VHQHKAVRKKPNAERDQQLKTVWILNYCQRITVVVWNWARPEDTLNISYDRHFTPQQWQ